MVGRGVDTLMLLAIASARSLFLAQPQEASRTAQAALPASCPGILFGGDANACEYAGILPEIPVVPLLPELDGPGSVCARRL